MVPPSGSAPDSPVFQTGAFTRLALAAMAGVLGNDPRLQESKSCVLPLHYTPTNTGLRRRNRTFASCPQNTNATITPLGETGADNRVRSGD